MSWVGATGLQGEVDQVALGAVLSAELLAPRLLAGLGLGLGLGLGNCSPLGFWQG